MRDPEFFLVKYVPVTTGFSIVGARLDEVVDHWITWQRGIWEMNGFKMPVQHIDGPLSDKLDALLPLDSWARLMTQTRDGRIAIFANFGQYDGSSDAPYLANYFKRDVLRVAMTKSRKWRDTNLTESTQFGWQDYGTKTDHWVGHKFRGISATKEDRWTWHEGGTPFPWEETEAYTAKRIKDRFTPEMLERYAKHMGVDLLDPEYYSGRAVITRLKPLPDPSESWYDLIAHYPNQ